MRLSRRGLFGSLVVAPLAALGLSRERSLLEEMCDLSIGGGDGTLSKYDFLQACRVVADEHCILVQGDINEGVPGGRRSPTRADRGTVLPPNK